MAINIRYSAPIVGLGAAALQTGQSLGATQALGANAEMTRFLLGHKENQRQFDTRQDFAQQQADRDVALRIRSEDIEQSRYNQNLALQDARQQQITYNQEADRQAALANQQMRMDYDAQQQAMQAQDQWAQKSAMSLDQQINEQLGGYRKMKLSPDGQLKLGELAGSWRKMQAEAGNFRPGPFAEAQAKLLADIERAGLDQYEVVEPTAQEKVYQNLVPLQGQIIEPGKPLPPGKYRSLKGTRNGQDTWEFLDIPETQQPLTAAERFEQNKVTLPNGGIALFDPETKKWTEFAPPKAEAAAKPVDTNKYLKEAADQLRMEHQLANAGSESAKPYKFDLNEAKKRARELMAAEKELAAELSNGGDDDEGLIPILGGSGASGIGTGLAGPVAGSPPSWFDDLMSRTPDPQPPGATMPADFAEQMEAPPAPPLESWASQAEASGQPVLGDPMQEPDILNAKQPATREEILSYKPGQVFFWNGQYARLESDGTVTVIE